MVIRKQILLIVYYFYLYPVSTLHRTCQTCNSDSLLCSTSTGCIGKQMLTGRNVFQNIFRRVVKVYAAQSDCDNITLCCSRTSFIILILYFPFSGGTHRNTCYHQFIFHSHPPPTKRRISTVSLSLNLQFANWSRLTIDLFTSTTT